MEHERTRIPSRFKQAANRVRRERSMPNRIDGEINVPTHPRRSSIPRLKTKPQTPKPEEDEFDKIYGEIVNSPVDIDVSILNNKVDDPIKVENRFEEIIHDYDEGKIQPITVENVATKIPRATDKAVKREAPANTEKKDTNHAIDKTTRIPKSIETSKSNIDITNGVPPEQAKRIQKQVSIDKSVSIEKESARPRGRLEKTASVDIPSEISLDKSKNTEKTAAIEKTKSRIPMLKRRSEAEIDVPKHIQPSKSNAFGNRIRVQDAISKFSKDNDNAKKLPTGKKIVDNAQNRDTNERTLNETIKDGKKYEIQTENVDIKVSYESDIGPENIVKVDAADKPNESVLEGNTVEIIEITPSNEIVDVSNDFQETIIQPCIVEVIDAPLTAPIGNNYQHVYIQDVTSPVTKEFKDIPKDISNASKDETEILPTAIKIVSVDEIKRISKELGSKPKRQLDAMKQADKNNIEDEREKEGLSEKPQNSGEKSEINQIDDLDDDTPIIRGKVSRMIGRLVSREDKVETKKDPEEEMPKPKSVLSKIAMFERQEPIDIPPSPKLKDTKIINKPINESIDFKPKIIDEVLKPIQRRSYIEDNVNRDYIEICEPKSLEQNSHSSKIKKIEAINVEVLPITKSFVANEVTSEESPSISEISPFDDHNKADIPDARNKHVKTRQYYGEEAPKYNENANHVELKPPKIQYFEIAKPYNFDPKYDRNRNETVTARPLKVDNIDQVIRPGKFESKTEDNKDDFTSSEPVQYEHFEPAKSIEFEHKVNENPTTTKELEPFNETNNKYDKIILNYENKTAQYDTVKKKEITESPFDFTPKKDSHRIKNYNEDNRSNNNKDYRSYESKNYEDYNTNETPSLDYVLDRLNKYKSTFDDSNLKKSKSVAELDLGDAVKGKVHDMIVRMKSVEKLAEKKEVISARERPRKKSVSEKIALFEGILSQTPLPAAFSQSSRTTQKPKEVEMAPGEFHAKMAELSNAGMTYGRMSNMTYKVLSNGKKMPILATGTALLDKNLTAHVIAAAIDMGYRAIDTAYIYGNEKEVGEGIRAKIEDGTVKREDLFITNKLWNTFHRQDLVEGACRQSLETMGLDYFDLYLVHMPMSFQEGPDPLPKIANVLQYSEHDYLDAWYGMEDLVRQGLVRSIGLSNFNSAQLQNVLDKAKIKPVVNMVESHPYLSQKRLEEFCTERHVNLLVYGVLGSKGTPDELKGSTAAVIDDPLIQVMAAGLGITPAQLLIRYQMDNGHAVVTKASSAAHLWDNLQALTVTLTPSELEAIRALNRNKRCFTFKGMGDTHKNYPFKIAY